MSKRDGVNVMDSNKIETLKKYLAAGEVVFIGPYSDANRVIEEIKGDRAYFANSNFVDLRHCAETDFGILTRLVL